MSTALLIVDIQNDYFENGSNPLHEPEAAAKNAAMVQTDFTNKGLPVFVIHHDAGAEASFMRTGSEGAKVHKLISTENVSLIRKEHPNSFLETRLNSELQEKGILSLVICGMMTHMCIDATVRAAADLGYKCTVISDACATKMLKLKEDMVAAPHVQTAFLAALASAYASVQTAAEYLESANIGQDQA